MQQRDQFYNFRLPRISRRPEHVADALVDALNTWLNMCRERRRT